MKRHYKNNRHRSPRSEITRIQEELKRERDPIDHENLRQHLDHWIRTLNNRQ